MRRTKTLRYITTAMLFTLVLILGAFPLTVHADSIHDVFIDVQIHADGSATLTELWDLDITNTSSTEWYLDRYNLDNMEFRDLAVTEILPDGSERQFEALASWDVNRSRSQKAYTCGIAPANGGYEICWGFGENGRHTYRVTYTISNLVKGYQGGDAMTYLFVGGLAGAKQVDFRLSADGFDFAYPETRIWVFGYTAESEFADGSITVTGDGKFSSRDYAAIMLAFEPGLLSPTDTRSDDVQTIIDKNMEGSVWEDGDSTSSDSLNFMFGFLSRIFGQETAVRILLSLSAFKMPLLMILLMILLTAWARSSSRRRQKKSSIVHVSKKTDYCRDLPYQGSLPATYAELYASRMVKETDIIGCMMLKWVQMGQVEIHEETVGMLRKKQVPALKLNSKILDMATLERNLYIMVLSAAGSDLVLQSKELEKWARRRYTDISNWLRAYRREGMEQLKQLGAYDKVESSKMFGLRKTTKTEKTAYGQELLTKTLGFARYLNDFTILAEREAPEVALWDDYLVFAHLFGLADKVAEQFAKLHPQYLADPNANSSFDNYHMRQDYYSNVIYATNLSNSLSRSVSRAYMAEEAHRQSSDSSSSGGGGSSSSSGGGSYSSGSGGSSSR